MDWESRDSWLFFNERVRERDLFISYIPRLPFFKSCVWLATSGRIRQKWVALSKRAFLVSARSVNRHLRAAPNDRWGICLPLFHVGGLSILARAHLSRSSCFYYHGRWSAKSFVDFIKGRKITLSSLTPTQVYDLARERWECPPFVRAVAVGGGPLSGALYQSARKLHWPLLPSYGLTECCSQAATADISSLESKEERSRLETPSAVADISPLGSGSSALLSGSLKKSGEESSGAPWKKEPYLKEVFEETAKEPFWRRAGGRRERAGKEPADSYDIKSAPVWNYAPRMKALSHVNLKISHGRLMIQSESLLEGFVPILPSLRGEFQDPKKEGWYATGDRACIEREKSVKPPEFPAPVVKTVDKACVEGEKFVKCNNRGGRKAELGSGLYLSNVRSSEGEIKILGEKVFIQPLEELLTVIALKGAAPGRYMLLPVPEDRAGFQISLVADVLDRRALSFIIREFNGMVSPFERIRQFYYIPFFPLTGILKISQDRLREKLGFSSRKARPPDTESKCPRG